MDTIVAEAVDPMVAVKDAILRLFPSYDALEGFLRANLGLWLNQITDRTLGLDVVAFKLVRWAESTGADKALAARLATTFPSDTGVAALVATLQINTANFPAQQAQFSGLTALAADPIGKQALLPYRLDLKQLCRIAVRIGGWKFLHDQVDYLRNNVGVPLEAIKARPTTPSDLMDVLNIANWLEKIVVAITAKVAEMALKDDDVPWIEDNLLPAKDELALATRGGLAKDKLDPVVTDLSFITTNELAVLNNNIKEMASTIESLSLPDKLAALERAIAGSSNAIQTSEEIGSVNQSVAQVLVLVDGHAKWQYVKDSFAGMLMALGSLGDARNAWGRLNRQINKIDEKPDDLVAAQTELDAALDGEDMSRVQVAIVSLNAVVNTRFFAIDKDLLIAAEALGKIGNSLQTVLEALDG